MTEDRKNRTVLVTGFGPFRDNPVNASWEAVKKLSTSNIEKECDISLIVKEIPVVYESVSTLVPKLWSEYDPMLTIHVGVSKFARCLVLESQAHKTGYKSLDVDNKCPIEGSDSSCEEVQDLPVKTEIDVEEICENLNCVENGNSCKAMISNNAGRYICEYTFYQSLAINPGKTIFVHVPNAATCSIDKTADGLKDIIRSVLGQIEVRDKKDGK